MIYKCSYASDPYIYYTKDYVPVLYYTSRYAYDLINGIDPDLDPAIVWYESYNILYQNMQTEKQILNFKYYVTAYIYYWVYNISCPGKLTDLYPNPKH